MEKKLIFFIFICSIFYSACSSDHGITDSKDQNITGNKDHNDNLVVPEVDTIVVKRDKPIHPIQSTFWGTNFLYWVDDDASLADGNIVDRLRAANIKLLRYPGGTVADNFHWATNTLDNIYMYPYEDGEAETDFDEFMQLCQQVGAEPSVVVNTESWVVKDSITAGAHEAANWLRYSKEQGYDVNYWEIGNETYWHPVMSAEEYAEVVNIYADSLKKIDPNIIIGANGHWRIDFVGTKERLKEGTYNQVMEYRRNINSREDYKTYQDFNKQNVKKPVTSGNPKWWRTVAERAGHNIDMIVVHRYFGPQPWQINTMGKSILKVRNLFSEMYPDKTFLFNMSEYNIANISAFDNDEHLYLTEAVGEMLRGGVDMTAFWPLRMKNINKPRLIDFQTADPSTVYKIFQKLSETLKGSLVQSTGLDEIPAYASYEEGSSATVVLTGRKIDTPTKVAIAIRDNRDHFGTGSIWRINGSRFNYEIEEEDLSMDRGPGRATIEIKPSEVVIITFK